MDCIFCKIVNGELPSAKIWESEEHVAILDINPNTKGAALVLTKQHYDSYIFDMPEDAYNKLLNAAKHAAKVLEKGLSVRRVAMVMEGTGINHAHIKLYPLHGLGEKFEKLEAADRVFFDRFPGYITTKLGPQADFAELKKLAEEIRRKAGIAQP
ncbi:MAG: HIT family protein [Candidatus Diapherotrites archaeon]|nr:HIT family protein [Candidatus Diapherotrites archaeon]